MSDQNEQELKKCPYCGRMTSAKANFCWWCARELSARPERPEPSAPARKLRVPVGWVLAALVTLAVVAVYFLAR
jgi:hypothetical protein